MSKPNKELRIRIINQIIQEIASRDRHFFSPHGKTYWNPEDRSAYFFIQDGRLYYRYPFGSWEWRQVIARNIGFKRHLPYGGTLRALLLDFRSFIQTGKYANHMHGNGGLYSRHWGYSQESMEAIRDVARKLGYLAESRDEDMVLSKQFQ